MPYTWFGSNQHTVSYSCQPPKQGLILDLDQPNTHDLTKWDDDGCCVSDRRCTLMWGTWYHLLPLGYARDHIAMVIPNLWILFKELDLEKAWSGCNYNLTYEDLETWWLCLQRLRPPTRRTDALPLLVLNTGLIRVLSCKHNIKLIWLIQYYM